MSRRSPLVLLVCLVCLGFAAAGGCRSRASVSGPPGTAQQTAAPGTAVAFTTPDGVRLEGRLVGTGKTAVVLAHMFPSDARSWFPMASRLAELGYAALAFNFRGYDGSGGGKDVAKADVDLKAAYDFVRSKGAEHVALIGASMGGTAAVILAAQVPAVALVAVSPPAMFNGLDATSAAPAVRTPTLLLAAEGDGQAAQSLRSLAGLIPGADAKLFSGDAHGTNLLERPEASEEVVAFLATHAPAGTPGSGDA